MSRSAQSEPGSESLIDGWNPDHARPGGPADFDFNRMLWHSNPRDAPILAGFSLRRDDAQSPPRNVKPAVDRRAASTRIEAGSTADPPIPGDLQFPEPGQELGGFRLIAELGRGAFARVFLAEQLQLANRQVALKVSEALGDEPQALARLQHAHIVPIHSVHDDPKTGFRLLCMPYLGGANLAQVLELAGHSHLSHTHGRSLVDALDQLGQDKPAMALTAVASRRRERVSARTGWSRVLLGSRGPQAATRGIGTPTRVRSAFARYFSRITHPRESLLELRDEPTPAASEAEEQPARRFFRSNNFARTTVWIIARLAEALDHAHARGLLHRDLKPSNVLIAADGTPMLLDFNLSEIAAEATAENAPRARVGGTLPYMAPEHLDAFNPAGQTPASAVDERSDIYALGLIFYEMLAGHHPFADPEPNLPIVDALDRMVDDRRRGATPIRQVNPAIPPSLEAVLGKCLAFDPDRRYSAAGELAEDLRRFLDDRPMKFAPEPSVRERLRKWTRRHPEVRSAGTIGALAIALLAVIGTAAWSIADRLEGAGAVLARNRFSSNFQTAQLLLNTTNGPENHLPEGIKIADAALAEYGLAGGRPQKNWAARPNLRRLEPAPRNALLEELSELLTLRARAGVSLAARDGAETRNRALTEAVSRLSTAERIDPNPPAALFIDRATYARALGWIDRAAADERSAKARGLRGARDYYLLGSALAAAGRNDEAVAYLNRSVGLDQRRFWAWFVLGMCRYDLGQYAESAADFSICTVLNPGFAWPYVNRGLALAAAGRFDEARLAYDRAIELAPGFVEAHVNRALLSLQGDQPERALRDLELVPRLDPTNPACATVLAEALHRVGRDDEAQRTLDHALSTRPGDASLKLARAALRWQRGESESARADISDVLAADPKHPRALYGLALIERRSQPTAALALLDKALSLDPRLSDALQLRALIRAQLGDPAAARDVEQLVKHPTPLHLYNGACALCVLSRRVNDPSLLDRAAALLRQAFQKGASRAHAQTDPDLEPLRSSPEHADLWK